MGDRDRRVLLDEQERGGHPDDGRAADHERVLAGDLDAGAPQDLDRRVGRRREEAVIAEAEEPRVEWMDPVDVLGRIDRVDDAPQTDRRRQRHLDDDPVDGRVGIEGRDGIDHRRLGRLPFELREPRFDPDLGAATQDLLEIDGRWCVPSDDHHRQAGRSSVCLRERLDVFRHGGSDLGGDRLAFEQPGRSRRRVDHARPASSTGSRRSPDATA